jgi:hypothetical protein
MAKHEPLSSVVEHQVQNINALKNEGQHASLNLKSAPLAGELRGRE